MSNIIIMIAIALGAYCIILRRKNDGLSKDVARTKEQLAISKQNEIKLQEANAKIEALNENKKVIDHLGDDDVNKRLYDRWTRPSD